MKRVLGCLLAMGMGMTMAGEAADRAEYVERIDAVTFEDVRKADIVAVVGCTHGSFYVGESWRGNAGSLELLFHAMRRLGVRDDGSTRNFLYLHWLGTPPLEALRTRRFPEMMNIGSALDGRRPYVLMAGTGKERYFFDWRVVVRGKDLWKPSGGRARW